MIRQCIWRAFLALALVSGATLGVGMMSSSLAAADDGGYPYAAYDGPGSDPASYWWTDPAGNGYSPYGYAYRNCTDFVAWKLNITNDFHNTSGLGNAYTWGGRATSHNAAVDMTPAVGAVAWWDANAFGMSAFGHVAWVSSVNGDQVTVEEYNNPPVGKWGIRTFRKDQVSGYIHFKDLQTNSSAPAGNTSQDGYFHGAAPDGAIIENHDGGLHKYVAIGGSLVWIPPETIWGYVDQMHGMIPSGQFHEIVWMHDSDIHAIEYGWGGDRSHVPGDNSFFYEAGSLRQYVIQYRYAFSVGSSEEVAYLGGVNRAVMVPPGLASRLSGAPTIPNDVVLKAYNQPAYYHEVNGTAFWADNFTVIDCVLTVKHGAIQSVPGSLIETLVQTGRSSSQPTHCSFPPNWALYGPGGAERWWIDGANPYTRHHYDSPLSLHCRLGSNPIEVQLPDTAGINQPVEGGSLSCPNNTYVRIVGNGEVFLVIDNLLHYVSSPATLSCLTHGHAEVVINVDGAVVATTPRGSNAYCSFEGKMLMTPDGRVDYVKDGVRHHVLNWAIVNCLKGRAGTGDPIAVDSATFSGYTDSGVNAYCPYEGEPGLNFVQEQGSPTVWLMGPATGTGPGVKRHAGGLCVNDPYTTQLKSMHVFIVPAGETEGHVQGADWWPSTAGCQALPQG